MRASPLCENIVRLASGRIPRRNKKAGPSFPGPAHGLITVALSHYLLQHEQPGQVQLAPQPQSTPQGQLQAVALFEQFLVQ